MPGLVGDATFTASQFRPRDVAPRDASIRVTLERRVSSFREDRRGLPGRGHGRSEVDGGAGLWAGAGRVGRLVLRRLAAWCYRRRRRVLAIWVVALIGFSVLGQTAGGALQKTFSLPGTESDRAFSVLEHEFARKGDTGDLVFEVRGSGDVNSPAVRNEIEPVFAQLRRQPHVVSVTSPYDPAGSRFVARGGKIAYAEILFDVRANDVPVGLASRMRTIAEDANSSRLRVELGGSMFTDQSQPASEVIGILAAVVILLLAFGSLLAMGMPIMTALFGIGIGLACVNLLARVLDVPSFAPQVAALIGIGVGIDYALFISTRYREALHEGRNPEQAVVHAIDSSGRAVLFAGGTVVISLLGLFFIGVPFIRGLAVGATLAVLFVMAAAVTLAPRRTRLRRLHDRPVRASRRPPPARRRAQFLDTLEQDVASAALARSRHRARDPRGPRAAVLLAAPRGRRRGERPDVVHDPTCLRPAHPRIRTRLQRATPPHERTAISPGQCRDGPTGRDGRP